jgi:glutaredoxin 2
MLAGKANYGSTGGMKLYIYDHCPFCVKAEMIFGLKGIPFEPIILLNDDEETPIRMIGQKMVPILEKDDGTHLPESMDIVAYVDGLDGKPIVSGPTRPVVAEWIAGTDPYRSPLVMPRWVQAPLPEFATEGARAYFTKKKEAMRGPFAEHLVRSHEYIAAANAHLALLEPLIVSPRGVNRDLSTDDFHLFATLRSLSIVKGLRFPPKVLAYMEQMATASGVALHTDIAL